MAALKSFVGRCVLPSVCSSVRPSVCPSLCSSVRLSVWLSVFCLSVYLSIHLAVWLDVCLDVRPSVCLSVCLSVRPSVCLCVCLSVNLSVSQFGSQYVCEELRSNISNRKDSVSSGFSNTEKKVENTTDSGVFFTKFKVINNNKVLI